jgi:hypothetical protein
MLHADRRRRIWLPALWLAVVGVLLWSAGSGYAVRKRIWIKDVCEGRVKNGRHVEVAVTNGWVIMRGGSARTHLQFTVLRGVNLLIERAGKLSFKTSPKQRRGQYITNLWFGISPSLMAASNDVQFTGDDRVKIILPRVDVESVRASSLRYVGVRSLRRDLAGGNLRGLDLKLYGELAGSRTNRVMVGLPGFFTPLRRVTANGHIEWVDARLSISAPLPRASMVEWQARYYPFGNVEVENYREHTGKNVLFWLVEP